MIRWRATRGLIAMGFWFGVILCVHANVVPSTVPVFPGEKLVEMGIVRINSRGRVVFENNPQGDVYRVQLMGGGSHAHRRLTSRGYYQVVNPEFTSTADLWVYPDFQVVPPQDMYLIGDNLYYGNSWADFEDQCSELRRVAAMVSQMFLGRAAFVSMDLRDDVYLRPATPQLLEGDSPLFMNCYLFIHHHDQFSRIKSRHTLLLEAARHSIIQYREAQANESQLRQVLAAATRTTQRIDPEFVQTPYYSGGLAFKEYFLVPDSMKKHEREFQDLVPRQAEATLPKQVEGVELQRIMNQLSQDAQVSFRSVCVGGKVIAEVVAEFISQDIVKFESVPIAIRFPDAGKRLYTMTCGLSLKSRQPRTTPTL